MGKSHDIVSTDIISTPKITVEALHLVIQQLKNVIYDLSVVKVDLELKQKDVELVHCLDFSEIHTFLWPERTNNQNRAITRRLLKEKNLLFTLPPGATTELVRHLRNLVSTNEEARKRFIEWLDKPLLIALMDFFAQNLEADVPPVIVDGLSEFAEDLKEVMYLNTRLRRLRHIKSMRNLKSFDTFVSSKTTGVDKKVFREGYFSLNLRRPSDKINNNIDAHNFSLVHHLTENSYINQNRVFVLVTSSPIPNQVFRKIRWENVHNIIPNIESHSLVRTPLQALYYAELCRSETSNKDIGEMIQSLSILIDKWQSKDKYKQYLNGDIPGSTNVKLPAGKKTARALVDYQSLYARYLTRVHDDLKADYILSENSRRSKTMDNWATGTELFSHLTDSFSQEASNKIVLDLFDDLKNKTLETISHNKKVLDALPRDMIFDVDTEGIIVEKKQLLIKKEANSQFDCIEITAVHMRSEISFSQAYVYSDRYSFWWPTKATLVDFLDSVRLFVAEARDSKTNGDLIPESEKTFDGIYLELDDDHEPHVHIPLNFMPELRSDDLYEIANMRPIKLVRIGMDLGDFCYETVSRPDFKPVAGFLSHVALPEPIATLIRYTNFNSISISEIESFVNLVLKDFKGKS